MNSDDKAIKAVIDSVRHARADIHCESDDILVDIRLLSTMLSFPYEFTLESCNELVKTGNYKVIGSYIKYYVPNGTSDDW